MSTSYDIGTLAQLKDGKLPFDKVHAMMSGFKNSDRFEKMLRLWQESVTWSDPIILPLSEHLFVVRKPDGKRVIKSKWGYEYCEAHQNGIVKANEYRSFSAWNLAECVGNS